MFDEALKWVGPYPLVQLAGAIVVLYLGVRSALAGIKNNAKEPLAMTTELPDWFLDDFKELQRNSQKTLWIVEDINNKIETLRGIAEKSLTGHKNG